jgi:hypothetical protein
MFTSAVSEETWESNHARAWGELRRLRLFRLNADNLTARDYFCNRLFRAPPSDATPAVIVARARRALRAACP